MPRVTQTYRDGVAALYQIQVEDIFARNRAGEMSDKQRDVEMERLTAHRRQADSGR